MTVRESASAPIDAPPALVFELLTDVSRLPEWNRAITEVVETPPRLTVGAVWKVRLRALGQSWVSKSEVSELDPDTRRFSYRSQSDDGNPSSADWTWQVEPADGGSTVSVSVDLRPVTFWRKHLLVKLRRPALRREMHASLVALSAAVRTT
jgi:uncharacterized protein YndB with AHSA1/START domain